MTSTEGNIVTDDYEIVGNYYNVYSNMYSVKIYGSYLLLPENKFLDTLDTENLHLEPVLN